jgi:hypothetical protein
MTAKQMSMEEAMCIQTERIDAATHRYDNCRAGNAGRRDGEQALLLATRMHSVVIKIALSAVVWFLAVMWLDFTGGTKVDSSLAVAAGAIIVLFTLLLGVAEFLKDSVSH